MSVNLRPHHGLCIKFFKGKGYSEDFTQNMARVIEMMNRDDPEITLTLNPDIICADCPKLVGGECGGKAEAYDRAVLRLCGLNSGDKLKWSELYKKTNREIVGKGLLSTVCGDCVWYSICGISGS